MKARLAAAGSGGVHGDVACTGMSCGPRLSASRSTRCSRSSWSRPAPSRLSGTFSRALSPSVNPLQLRFDSSVIGFEPPRRLGEGPYGSRRGSSWLSWPGHHSGPRGRTGSPRRRTRPLASMRCPSACRPPCPSLVPTGLEIGGRISRRRRGSLPPGRLCGMGPHATGIATSTAATMPAGRTPGTVPRGLLPLLGSLGMSSHGQYLLQAITFRLLPRAVFQLNASSGWRHSWPGPAWSASNVRSSACRATTLRHGSSAAVLHEADPRSRAAVDSCEICGVEPVMAFHSAPGWTIDLDLADVVLMCPKLARCSRLHLDGRRHDGIGPEGLLTV